MSEPRISLDGDPGLWSHLQSVYVQDETTSLPSSGMTPDEIPASYREALDRAAGKEHSATGSVMTALAEILTLHRRDLLGDQSSEPPLVSASITTRTPAKYRLVDAETGETWVLTSEGHWVLMPENMVEPPENDSQGAL